MGLAAILMASQIKPGGMLDPSKIIGQLQPTATGGQQQQQQQHGQYQGQQQYGAPQGQHDARYASSGATAGAAASYYSGAPQQHSGGNQQYGGAPSQGYGAPQQWCGQQSYGQPSPNPSYGGGGYQQQGSYSGGMPSPNAFPTPSHASSGYGAQLPAFPMPKHDQSYSQPSPQHYGSQQGFPHPAHNGGHSPSYPPSLSSFPSPPPQQGNYDPNRGLGTVAGAAALGGGAYYAYHKFSGAKLPFGGSHVGAGAAGASDPNYIREVLEFAVQDQNIQAFYPPGSLEPLAQHIARNGAVRTIAAQYRVTEEVALDLVRLALFDVVLYIDDSGSMKFEENGSRIDDLKLVVSRAVTAAGLFDTDGISIRYMNSERRDDNVTSEQAASQIISQLDFSGMTPLGKNLRRKVVEPLLLAPARSCALRKPMLIIAITDGEPTGESRDELAKVIKQTKQELSQTRYGADAFSLELAAVGNDQGARRFLEEIDSHPEIGRYVDVTSNFENEQDNMRRANPPVQLTPDLYVLKLLLGGCDSAYDRKDER